MRFSPYRDWMPVRGETSRLCPKLSSPDAVGAGVTHTPRKSGRAIVVALFAFSAAQTLLRSASAGELTIDVEREGKFVSVKASVEVNANQRVAWEVLTDYAHLAEFIPDMKSSRVVKRDGSSVVVEQKGEFGFLFFKKDIDVTMAVSEQPPRRIDARAIAGNLKNMEASYELKASADGMQLGYTGRFVPDFFLPPLIGMPLVRRSLERRLRAMVNEIERRDGLARGQPTQQ